MQTGPPPPGSDFNTGRNVTLPADPQWTMALDSINGDYKPVVIMSSLDPIYYLSGSAEWISFSATGEHTGSRFFFYKIEFDLPCYNLCGKSYNEDNSFCLNLDLYADNSIYEVYVNGFPQSGNMGNIPLPDPYNPIGHTQSDRTLASLCKNWQAGRNVLIIQVASSATVAGLLVQPARNPPPPPDADTLVTTICEGESVHFGDSDLTKPGYYFYSFPLGGGCDSAVVLQLNVNPKPHSLIEKSICEGESYEGYQNSGMYVDTYTSAAGCDSMRTLRLTVQNKPRPQLPALSAICRGDSLLLSPGAFLSYQWQDGSTLDHFVVRSPGVYAVQVTNSCGMGEGRVAVTDGICDIYFPSAFSPNSDGKNDFFKILTDAQMQEYHLLVFNRWGEKVFEAYDPRRGWDGLLQGVEQQSGVFIWTCSFKRAGIVKEIKGTVVLIR